MSEETLAKKTYVCDIIGDDYTECWQAGNVVYIETQTGSGKTTFVLNKLLPYALEGNKKILLLVSRSILKEQLLKELTDMTAEKSALIYEDIYNTIEINTYQSFIKDITAHKNLQHFDFIVSDECHFFLSDATFNSGTALAYDFIMSQESSIRIFMSATIENFKQFSRADLPNYVNAN